MKCERGICMHDLSYTQEFLLCVLTPKGTIPFGYSTQISTCLVAGGILELLNLNVIALDEKKNIVVNNQVELEKEHLKPLYQVICNSKKKSVNDIAMKYTFSSSKLLNEYMNALCKPMIENNLITSKVGGIFKHKTLYIPNKDGVLRVIEKLRAEFLEKGPISTESIVLGSLLQKCRVIKRYFSQYESDILKERLNEIKVTSEGVFVKELVDYIDTVIAVLASLG